MKLAIVSSAVMAVLPLSAAWSLQLYDNENYRNIIHDRSGTWGQACKNLGSNVNKAQSMHWDFEGPFSRCKIKLFDSGDCSGEPLADSNYANWNLPAFSARAKNKVNSYDIDCR
ncbi:fungal specific transcription factor [Purpureocillium lavendulum]|uniref:Fungal specific transcription factor n=1 Tax=Purpureocillium lavendulum TaxID=1247861 RepID=A0AB34FGV9_9HYPO|nr:fungal specific transcription factor [Purpureocillium lavendulum]